MACCNKGYRLWPREMVYKADKEMDKGQGVPNGKLPLVLSQGSHGPHRRVLKGKRADESQIHGMVFRTLT